MRLKNNNREETEKGIWSKFINFLLIQSTFRFQPRGPLLEAPK